MAENCPLHYTTDGDTLWLECFRDDPDAENGVIISAIEPGTSWAEVEALVAQHKAEHGSGEEDGDA